MSEIRSWLVGFKGFAGQMVLRFGRMMACAVGPARRRRSPAALALIAVVLTGTISGHAGEIADIRNRRAAERTDFNDAEIKDGFFKIAFRPELQLGPSAERVRKFDEPVRIFLVNKGLPDRRREIAAIIAEIQARVNHLDLALTDKREAANFTVTLVPSHDFSRTLRTLHGAKTAARIEQSLEPQCLSGIGKDNRFRIRRAEVILPVDAGDFTFRDCAYEEILQALGAINDDHSVPWTMFNDDVQMGFFDVYDQYLLNILYDPRIRPGMTKDQSNAVLPTVLTAVRVFVLDGNQPRPEDAITQRADQDLAAGTARLENARTGQTRLLR
jgi:hypothetical protein